MKRLLLVLTLFAAANIYAQHDSLVYMQLNFNENNKITFTKIIDVEETSAGELFVRARKWLSDYYNSAETIIDLEDKEQGIIIAKPLGQVGINSTFGLVYVKMNYTINLYVKDNKYKYEITDLIHEATPSSHNNYSRARTPMEAIILDDMLYRRNGKVINKTANWKIGTIKHVQQIAYDLEKGMQSPIISNSDW